MEFYGDIYSTYRLNFLSLSQADKLQMNERTSTRRMYAPYKMNTNDFRNSLIHVVSLAEYSTCKEKERKTQKQACT